MIADVLRRMFFFPAGVRVLRQVLHCGLSGGAVMHEMSGMLPDVPVPRKMSSVSLSAITEEAMVVVERQVPTMRYARLALSP